MMTFNTTSLNAQNNEPFSKMILSEDRSLYFANDKAITKLKDSFSSVVVYNSELRSEKYGDKTNQLNYIIVDDKLITLYVSKGFDQLIFRKEDYWAEPWRIRFECVDLKKIGTRKNKGILFFPSFQGLKLSSYEIALSKTPIYYDFIEYKKKVLLFLKADDLLYIYESKMPFVDAYLFPKENPKRQINRWEICNKLTVPEELASFVVYLSETENIIVSFDNNVDYMIDSELNSIRKITTNSKRRNVLLQAQGNYYWIDDNDAEALKSASNPIDYFESKIINNEK